MKRILIYVAILAAVLVLPTSGIDVAKLQPVQTIAVYREEENWTIKTDTDDIGSGISVEAAFDNLIETTPAIIYLDTADFVVVQENAVEAIEVLRSKLKGSVALFAFKGDPDLKTVSKYLSVHGKKTMLKNWNETEKLPMLDCTTTRYLLL